MKQKFIRELPHGVKAVVTLSLEVPQSMAEYAEGIGIGQAELNNLIGQEFQRLADELGLTEPGGLGS